MKIHKYLVAFLVFIAALLAFYFYNQNKIDVKTSNLYILNKEMQERVSKNLLNPIFSSRYYALLNNIYSEELEKTNSECAKYNSELLINEFFPTQKMDIVNPKNCTDETYNKWIAWHKEDENFSKKEFTVPNITQYWKSDTNTDPVSPNAGQQKRFLLKTEYPDTKPDFDLQKSSEYVFQELNSLDSQEVKDIQFFAGGPGTEGPSGIWVNIYNSYLIDNKVKISEEKYAKEMQLLTSSVADSFSECWRIKYKYWVPRPSMVNENIKPFMNNPNFPSYLSGHSTISTTASGILSYLYPQSSEYFVDLSTRAATSRVNAGIHYKEDTDDGTKVGEFVAKEIVSSIQK